MRKITSGKLILHADINLVIECNKDITVTVHKPRG